MTANDVHLMVPDADGWRRWLEAHHGEVAGVRPVVARKGITEPTSLTLAQAIDEALCFGVGRRPDSAGRRAVEGLMPGGRTGVARPPGIASALGWNLNGPGRTGYRGGEDSAIRRTAATRWSASSIVL